MSDLILNNKVKFTIFTLFAAVGCAGIIYSIYKIKYKLKKANNAFKYLTIKIITTTKECDAFVTELHR